MIRVLKIEKQRKARPLGETSINEFINVPNLAGWSFRLLARSATSATFRSFVQLTLGSEAGIENLLPGSIHDG